MTYEEALQHSLQYFRTRYPKYTLHMETFQVLSEDYVIWVVKATNANQEEYVIRGRFTAFDIFTDKEFRTLSDWFQARFPHE